MDKFTFNGTWSDGHNLPELGEEEDFIDYVHRLGFSTVSATYGNEYGAHVEIYEAHAGNAFLATVSPTGNSVFRVYIPSFISYMQFMRDFVAPFAAGAAGDTQRDILETMRKLFRAEHGHSADDVCGRCDPEEVKRRAEARRKLAQQL